MDDDDLFILEVNKQFQNKEIDYNKAQNLLYEVNNRKKRFHVFIALFYATLKNNPTIAIKVFREAYCASDNIYSQIKESEFSFDIKLFLKSMQIQNVNFRSLLNDYEETFYSKLPSELKIYRGMSSAEFESKEYGISWSISKEEAEQYAYFHQNNVKAGEGRLFHLNISKENILTVFCVHTSDKVMYEVIYI